MFESCRGHSLLMQVSGGFLVSADWSWLVVVGAVVGDCMASDDSRWSAMGNSLASWSSILTADCAAFGESSCRRTSTPNPHYRRRGALKATASLNIMLN